MAVDKYQELSSEAIVLFGRRRYREAAERFEQALAIPSEADDRPAVEWTAGITYTHFIEPNVPLSRLIHEPYFRRAIDLMEGAIKRDLVRGGTHFKHPSIWPLTCQLDNLYASVADVLEEEQSNDAALSYLLEREQVIRVGAMPESSARIGQYFARRGNDAKAIEWYQHVAAMPILTGDAHESRTREVVSKELSRLTKNGGCFVVTAAFTGSDTTAIEILRRFRDERLEPRLLGRCFVRVYYVLSPPLAHFIARSEFRKRIARVVLLPFVRIARVRERRRAG